MRLALVCAGSIPNPDSSGAALTNWTLASYFLARGHEVGVVAVHAESYADPDGRSAEERLAALRALGAEVRPVLAARQKRRPLRQRVLRPPAEELFPNLVDAPAVRAAVEELAPDAAFVYHWDGLAASRGLRGRVPRLGVVVDLPHLPSLYRFRHERKRLDRQTVARLLLLQASLRRQPRLAAQLLDECEAAGDFAAHHAEWLRRHGVPGCEYLRTPVPDPGPPERRESRAVLLIGHLRGTSTLDGLALFARDVLPQLPEDVEVRIAGGWKPPPDLARELARPNVSFLGHLARPDDEFRSAAALVVPTAVPLGARVRILSAFSFACPVVAHVSNTLGIPELVNSENALLGRTGAELAAATVRLVEKPELRARIGAAGRETYERCFSPPVAAGRLEELLAEIAGAGARAPSSTSPETSRIRKKPNLGFW